QVLVAGDITNSVFAASVQPKVDTTTTPSTLTFGTPQDLVLPTGHITAKVEGTINNSTATPDQPTKAFYAQAVDLKTGPVVPPNNPEPPFPGPKQPVHAPGLHHSYQTMPFTANPKDVSIPSNTKTAGHATSTLMAPQHAPTRAASTAVKAKAT